MIACKSLQQQLLKHMRHGGHIWLVRIIHSNAGLLPLKVVGRCWVGSAQGVRSTPGTGLCEGLVTSESLLESTSGGMGLSSSLLVSSSFGMLGERGIGWAGAAAAAAAGGPNMSTQGR